jgi:hypothetical protein
MRIAHLVAGLAAVLAVAACGTGEPPSGSQVGVPADREHAQAGAALARWAAAAAGGGAGAIGIVGERTGQIGDWEEPVGENNKIALMSGLVKVGGDVPDVQPPSGTVTWADGSTASVNVLSAHQAVAAMVEAAVKSGNTCPECRPLTITSARLIDGPIETSKGSATGPTWQFTLGGTRVVITQVAIAETVDVQPPPWDPNDPPVGLSIGGAVGDPASADLIVTFIGAPGPASKPCGADYSGEAVESELAIVVIVHEHRQPFLGACAAVGAPRTAEVHLGKPLGERAVLEVTEGRPVPIQAP